MAEAITFGCTVFVAGQVFIDAIAPDKRAGNAGCWLLISCGLTVLLFF